MTWQIWQQLPLARRSLYRWAASRYSPSTGAAFRLRKAPTSQQARHESTTSQPDKDDQPLPYRQQYKLQRRDDKATKLRAEHLDAGRYNEDGWKLTVGIEIHAELDVERKLFSTAPTTATDSPNVNVSINDLAYPGAQPLFQPAVLLPALRAALALGCQIQTTSTFDRKHYFYQDQPAGYQITQFYSPFAKKGYVGWVDEQAWPIREYRRVRIQQVQLEQDTAKSLVQGNGTVLLDFNRVSHPLIEIISYPEIHTPEDAATFVRKIHAQLRAVGAVTAGMETGALRADVNVSVSRVPQRGEPEPPLGQRVEIKNLSSFKAIQDAVAAEKRRQVAILCAGGTIAAETRGWTLGGKETHKLRGKEGEVDYRYMPDPDIQPLIISEALVDKLRESLPDLPDTMVRNLNMAYDVTPKDATTILTVDDGARLDYFDAVVQRAVATIIADPSAANRHLTGVMIQARAGRTACNLILHDIGALMTKTGSNWDPEAIPADKLAALVALRLQKRIHVLGMKALLTHIFHNEHDARTRDLVEVARSLDLLYADAAHNSNRIRRRKDDFSDEMLDKIVEGVTRDVIQANPEVRRALAKATREGNTRAREGKLNFLVGQVMRVLARKALNYFTDPAEVKAAVHNTYDMYWGHAGSGAEVPHSAPVDGDKPSQAREPEL